MIYFLVNGEHDYTMRSVLSSWGKELANRIAIVPYKSIFARDWTPPGPASTLIYSDLERLDPKQRAWLADFNTRLMEDGGPRRVLNDPRHCVVRHDLLRVLYDLGINEFDAYPLSRSTEPARFPVFLRTRPGHKPEAPKLLRTRAKFRRATAKYRWLPGLFRPQTVIEFCNTADESGMYRKYGAFIVGDRILPRHIFFSRNWMLKEAKIVEPALIEEELTYLDENPHAEQLRECIRPSHISYGRVDYGMLGGRLQIWEINTNPMTGVDIEHGDLDGPRAPANKKFMVMFLDALTALAAEPKAANR